jgi:hypothetical protein
VKPTDLLIMRDRRDITWPSLLGVAGAYGPPAGAFVAAIKQCGAVLAMHFPPRALKAQRAAGQRLCKSIHSVLVAITEGRVRRVSLLDSEDMTGRPEKR